MLARLGRIFPALAAAPAPTPSGALVLKHRIDDYRFAVPAIAAGLTTQVRDYQRPDSGARGWGQDARPAGV